MLQKVEQNHSMLNKLEQHTGETGQHART